MRMDKLEQRIGPGVRDAVSTDATRRRGTDATHATACRTTECGLASDGRLLGTTHLVPRASQPYHLHTLNSGTGAFWRRL